MARKSARSPDAAMNSASETQALLSGTKGSGSAVPGMNIDEPAYAGSPALPRANLSGSSSSAATIGIDGAHLGADGGGYDYNDGGDGGERPSPPRLPRWIYIAQAAVSLGIMVAALVYLVATIKQHIALHEHHRREHEHNHQNDHQNGRSVHLGKRGIASDCSDMADSVAAGGHALARAVYGSVQSWFDKIVVIIPSSFLFSSSPSSSASSATAAPPAALLHSAVVHAPSPAKPPSHQLPPPVPLSFPGVFAPYFFVLMLASACSLDVTLKTWLRPWYIALYSRIAGNEEVRAASVWPVRQIRRLYAWAAAEVSRPSFEVCWVGYNVVSWLAVTTAASLVYTVWWCNGWIPHGRFQHHPGGSGGSGSGGSNAPPRHGDSDGHGHDHQLLYGASDRMIACTVAWLMASTVLSLLMALVHQRYATIALSSVTNFGHIQPAVVSSDSSDSLGGAAGTGAAPSPRLIPLAHSIGNVHPVGIVRTMHALQTVAATMAVVLLAFLAFCYPHIQLSAPPVHSTTASLAASVAGVDSGTVRIPESMLSWPAAAPPGQQHLPPLPVQMDVPIVQHPPSSSELALSSSSSSSSPSSSSSWSPSWSPSNPLSRLIIGLQKRDGVDPSHGTGAPGVAGSDEDDVSEMRRKKNKHKKRKHGKNKHKHDDSDDRDDDDHNDDGNNDDKDNDKDGKDDKDGNDNKDGDKHKQPDGDGGRDGKRKRPKAPEESPKQPDEPDEPAEPPKDDKPKKPKNDKPKKPKDDEPRDDEPKDDEPEKPKKPKHPKHPKDPKDPKQPDTPPADPSDPTHPTDPKHPKHPGAPADHHRPHICLPCTVAQTVFALLSALGFAALALSQWAGQTLADHAAALDGTAGFGRTLRVHFARFIAALAGVFTVPRFAALVALWWAATLWIALDTVPRLCLLPARSHLDATLDHGVYHRMPCAVAAWTFLTSAVCATLGTVVLSIVASLALVRHYSATRYRPLPTVDD